MKELDNYTCRTRHVLPKQLQLLWQSVMVVVAVFIFNTTAIGEAYSNAAAEGSSAVAQAAAPCTGPCDGLRTQTQGGWGAQPSGGNNGTYLYNNFTNAFPNGVVIGDVSATDNCTGNTLRLTSAQAVTAFLPSGSTARALGGNYTNPGDSYNNVLAGQAVALTISIGFDAYYADFAPSTTLLRDAIVAEGTFKGWTVAQVLAEANRVLAGCSSTYTFSQLNDALSSINESFVDGTKRSDFISCVIPSPNAPTLVAVQPNCTVRTGTITISSSTTGLMFSLNGGAFAAYPAGGFTGLAANTYTITARNAAGCVSDFARIVINPAPAIPLAPVFAVVQPTCTVRTGTITLTGTAGMEYSFNGGAFTAYPVGGFTGLAAGSYPIIARNAAGCVSVAAVAVINVAPAIPLAPVFAVVQPTCTVRTGTITLTGTAGMEYSFNGGAFAAYPTGGWSGLAAGNYSIIARNADGCVSVAAVAVINVAPAIPVAPVLVAVQPNCTVRTGSITIANTTGLMFSVNGGAFAAYPTGGWSGLAAGNYSIIARNADGCVSVAAVAVINVAPAIPVAPVLVAVQPNCTVRTGSITIANTTGLMFSVNGGAFAAYPTGGWSGLAAGNYSIIARNADGCVSVAAVAVINVAPAIPVAPVLVAVQPNCTVRTGAITIANTTGLTFSVNGGAFAAYPTNGWTGLADGTYSIIARNAAGCVSVAAVVVINPAPAIPVAPVLVAVQPTCTVRTGAITIANTTGLTFSVNGGNFINYPTGGWSGLTDGTYSIIARNAAGCVSVAAVVVINPAPAIPVAPVLVAVQPTCTVRTGAITIANTTGLTFSVNGGDFINYPTGGWANLAAGNYSIIARNAAGCVSVAAVAVINVAPAIPVAPVLVAVQPTCTVRTGAITIANTAGLMFSVNGGDFINYPTGGWANLAAGNYSIIARNAAGCVSVAAVAVINVAPAIPVAPVLVAVQPTCTVRTGAITIANTAGLMFSVNGGDFINYPTGGWANLAAGNYSIIARNAAGCVSVAAVVVINPAPAIPVAPVLVVVQPTCTVRTGSVTVSSDTDGMMFSLNGGEFTAYPALANRMRALEAGTYTVIARNAAGCVSVAAVVVINPAPAIPVAPVLVAVQPTCTVRTGAITIANTTGLTFSVNGGTFAAYPTNGWTGLAAGNFSIVARNAFGCVSTAAVVVINPAPAIPVAPVLVAVQPNCTVRTGAITIANTDGMMFSVNGGAFAAYPTGGWSGLAAGNYSIIARNAAGCVSVAAVAVINVAPAIPVAPVLVAVQPTCTVRTGAITIANTAGLMFSVNGGDFINYPTGGWANLAAGNYSIIARNAAGCVSTAAVVVINAAPAIPVAPVLVAVQPTCTVRTGSVTVSSDTDGMMFSVNGAAFINYPTGGWSGLTDGTYSIIARNAAGCVSVAAVVVINPAPAIPVAPVLVAVQPTCTVRTGAITIANTTGLTFSVNGGDFINYPTGGWANLAAGNYSIIARNAAGCVSVAAVAVINVAPAIPVAPVLVAVQPTCTVRTGAITIANTAGLMFSVNGGDFINYPTGGWANLAAGNYSIIARNAAGCVSVAAVVVINPAPAIPVAPVLVVVQPTCTVRTGSVTVSSDTDGMMFSLNGGEFTAYPALANRMRALEAGTYTVIARNAAGCVSVAAVVVINVAPAIPVAPVLVALQPNCERRTGSITISSGTEGMMFSVNGGTFAAYPAGGWSGLAAGTYSIVARNNGTLCVSTAAVITINTAPAIPVAPVLVAVQPNCTVRTGGITIANTAGMMFSVNGGAFVNYPAGGWSGLAAGTYSIVARNNGTLCVSTAAVITINTAPAIPVAPVLVAVQPNCTVRTGGITIANTAGMMFSVNGGAFVNYPAGGWSGLAAGTYSIVARNNGTLCVSTAAVITINTAPAIPLAPVLVAVQPTCVVTTGSITIANTTGFTFSVNGGAFAAYPTNGWTGLAAGSYSIVARNAAGCVSVAAVVVINAAPVTARVCHMIAFEYNRFNTGLISTISTPAGPVAVTGRKRNADGSYATQNHAAIFDTQNPTGNDNDLYTTDWGQALIINQDLTSVPNDNQYGGQLILDFSATGPVTLESVKVLDIDTYSSRSWIYLYDANGTELYRVQLQPLGNNSKQTVNLGNTRNVMRMVVMLEGRDASGNIVGSGAIDDIRFCVEGGVPAAPVLVAVQPTCTVGTGSITIANTTGLMFSVNGGAFAAYPTGGFTGLAAGTYSIVARNAAGCLSTASVVVINIRPAIPVAPVLVAVQPTCVLATGSITIANTTGLTFSVNGAAFAAYPVNGWTGLAAGNYSIIARNAAGCVSTAAVVVINAQPVAPAPVCHTIAFEYNRFNTGLISTISTPAGQVGVMGRKRNADGSYATQNHAALFDTQNPTGNDTDLYTTDWGQALIINQDLTSVPNDNQYGGELILDFSAVGPVTLESLKALDIDTYGTMSFVILYDRNGNELNRVRLQPLGNNSKQTVNLGNTRNVMTVRIVLDGRNNGSLAGSGAIDDIRFCVERPCGTTQSQQIAVNESNVEATAYPMPFNDKTTIEFKLKNTEDYVVNLYDMRGSLIKQLKAGTARAGEVTQVEVSGRELPEGMYIARIASETGAKSVKLILKR